MYVIAFFISLCDNSFKEGDEMFPERLKSLRKEGKMKQSELAGLLSMAQNTISQYEQGLREPDNDTLKTISDIFNVSTDYLLGKADIPNIEMAEPFDPDAIEIARAVESDQELRIMFDKTKNLSKEEKAKIIEMLQVMFKEP